MKQSESKQEKSTTQPDMLEVAQVMALMSGTPLIKKNTPDTEKENLVVASTSVKTTKTKKTSKENRGYLQDKAITPETYMDSVIEAQRKKDELELSNIIKVKENEKINLSYRQLSKFYIYKSLYTHQDALKGDTLETLEINLNNNINNIKRPIFPNRLDGIIYGFLQPNPNVKTVIFSGAHYFNLRSLYYLLEQYENLEKLVISIPKIKDKQLKSSRMDLGEIGLFNPAEHTAEFLQLYINRLKPKNKLTSVQVTYLDDRNINPRQTSDGQIEKNHTTTWSKQKEMQSQTALTEEKNDTPNSASRVGKLLPKTGDNSSEDKDIGHYQGHLLTGASMDRTDMNFDKEEKSKNKQPDTREKATKRKRPSEDSDGTKGDQWQRLVIQRQAIESKQGMKLN